MEWRENDGVRWLQADLPGATAAFATRLGGVSEGEFASLNLGAMTDDAPAAVAENRRRLIAALGIAGDRVAHGHQVHGAVLASDPARRLPSFVAGPQAGTSLAEVDGQVVAEPGTAALVFVADCLPVALVGPGGLAMLHCGWRPLAAGIVARGVAAVGATAAAIGPGIGPCCYEVGPDVPDFSADGPIRRGPLDVSARRQLDLPGAVRVLLEGAGVERVETAGLCTACEPDLFFSHRRDAGRTGRQAGLAWLEP